MCLVLKLDNGYVVSIADGQSHPNNVLVYTFKKKQTISLPDKPSKNTGLYLLTYRSFCLIFVCKRCSAAFDLWKRRPFPVGEE